MKQLLLVLALTLPLCAQYSSLLISFGCACAAAVCACADVIPEASPTPMLQPALLITVRRATG